MVVALRRLVGVDVAEYSVQCPPKSRTAVIVVRAQNGPNLPILHLGRQVGTTDGSGAAHLVFEREANAQLELKLDASGASPKLRPSEAVASFTVHPKDDIYLFDQKFEVISQPIRRPKKPPVDDGPKPLR